MTAWPAATPARRPPDRRGGERHGRVLATPPARGYSLAAGFAGVRVVGSRRTVNGFRLRCVDYRTTGVAGTSTARTTARGTLGYSKVAGIPASFEITSYSRSPAATLFELPPGAIVTGPPK